MKEFTLTGVAQETTLRTHSSQFFLVFNHGELRVPVDSDAAEVVLSNFYVANPEANPQATAKETEQEGPPPSEKSGYGEPSEQDYSSAPNVAMQSLTDDEYDGEDFDADGVGQV